MYPRTEEQGREWCEALRDENPELGEHLLDLLRDEISRNPKGLLAKFNSDLDAKTIGSNFSELCQYAATGKHLQQGENKPVEATDTQKRDFYDSYSQFPALVETMHKKWKAMDDLAEKDWDIRIALDAVIFEAALYAAAAQAWRKDLEFKKVPRELYPSILRKTNRMKAALKQLDVILQSKESPLNLYWTVQSHADAYNNLATQGLRSKKIF